MTPPVVLTALYVPADRPDRFDKAARSGADIVIVDLEDAVAPPAKDAARAAAARWLGERSSDDSSAPAVQVRVNAPDSPWFEADLRAITGTDGEVGVRLPKAQSVADVDRLLAIAGASVRVHALIETAIGLERAYDIASHPAVATLCLGEADLASDLRTSAEVALDWARSRVVVAARAAALPAPMMGAYPSLGDDVGLRGSCHHGLALGFVGRTAVHPRQLRTIVEAFRPLPREVRHAQSVVATLESAGRSGAGVTTLPDGAMVDPAMLAGAREVLDREAAVVDGLLRLRGRSAT